MNKEINVFIVMGSTSDLPAFEQAQHILKTFNIGYTLRVLSAHRTPKQLIATIESLPPSVKVIIAGAGGAAHLAGVVAAHTLKPVIGVPMESALQGLDSLLSTSQMPAGIPVATVAIGKAGATNAALLAAHILGLSDPRVEQCLKDYRQAMVAKVEASNQEILHA